jgi:hypothetical protein
MNQKRYDTLLKSIKSVLKAIEKCDKSAAAMANMTKMTKKTRFPSKAEVLKKSNKKEAKKQIDEATE